MKIAFIAPVSGELETFALVHMGDPVGWADESTEPTADQIIELVTEHLEAQHAVVVGAWIDDSTQVDPRYTVVHVELDL